MTEPAAGCAPPGYTLTGRDDGAWDVADPAGTVFAPGVRDVRRAADVAQAHADGDPAHAPEDPAGAVVTIPLKIGRTTPGALAEAAAETARSPETGAGVLLAVHTDLDKLAELVFDAPAGAPGARQECDCARLGRAARADAGPDRTEQGR
jgi:hypothetical protein